VVGANPTPIASKPDSKNQAGLDAANEKDKKAVDKNTKILASI